MKPGIEVPNMTKMSDLLNDISAGVRSFDFSKCVDFDWDVPLCWDQFVKAGDGDTFSFKGAGLIKSVLHRTYTDPTPAMYARSCWLSHFVVEGVTWIEDRDNPSPMISLAYTDRWLWRNASVMGGPGRGLELGVGGTLDVWGHPTQGVASEFSIEGRSEFIECAGEGLYAFGARNFTISGRTSFERNGKANGAPDLSLEADPGARCGHGTIKGVAFESDVTKTGLLVRGGQAMKIGDNRHVLAGMDATCDDSDWYPNVVYYDAPMHRSGSNNRWIGRRQVLTGPWYNRQLADEDESLFDLRLQADGSCT